MLVRSVATAIYGNKNPSMEILLYIMEHTDPYTKEFSRTYDQIQKDLHVNRATIASVFSKLSDAGCITNMRRSVWKNNMVGDLDDSYNGKDFLIEFKGV